MAVIYTVECAHHVAARVPGTQVIGFAGCYADPYASATLRELAVHPNVASAVLISLGCESTNVDALAGAIAARGKPVEVLRIQDVGGHGKPSPVERKLRAPWLAELYRKENPCRSRGRM